MALARHHGVPARLLDWSRHPLKAALFAGIGAARNENKSGNLSVWAFSLDMLDLAQAFPEQHALPPPPFTIVTAPAATNSNLHAQEGVFTIGQRICDFDGRIDRRPFDQLLVNWASEHRVQSGRAWFHRITFPKRLAEQLCCELAYEGITRASLFPNFYGVVETMKDSARWHAGGDNGDGPQQPPE
jgi:hypothetical protein